MNSLKSLTDEELVAVVVDKDQSAYAVLVHRYEKALTRYVCSMLGDPADAADAVQETFIATSKPNVRFCRQTFCC